MLKEGSLIVSCQAAKDSPFAATPFICAFAEAAVRGGAGGLRIEGIDNIRAVRAQQQLPIIGLIKRRLDGYPTYITPELSDVAAIAQAGADIVAFDATCRPRPVAVSAMIRAIHDVGRLAMADISNVAEALAAREAGADYVSTTLAGYIDDAPVPSGPDFELISQLVALGVCPIAEGRLRTPAEACEARKRGAFAVVVGSAITRPDVITRWFSEALACRESR